MSILFVLGRIAFVLIFILSGTQKLMDIPGTAAAIESKVVLPEFTAAYTPQLEATTGMTTPTMLAILAGVVEIGAALMIAANIGTRIGAVLLILLRVITPDEAYAGLRPEVLMLIAGMVVVGIALDVTGLAGAVADFLINSLDGISPLVALIVIYGATLFATELLSNATVAVLFTPIAVSLGEAFGVSPFLGPIIGTAAAAIVAVDPRRIIWATREAAPAPTTVASTIWPAIAR